MHPSTRNLISAAGAVLIAGSAQAGSIVQIQSFSFVPNGTQTLVFDQFDPNGGELGIRTLTSITISWQLIKTGGSLYVDNDSTTPGSGSITQSVIIDLLSTDVALTDTGFSAIGQNITAVTSYTATVGADDGDIDAVVGNSDGFQTGGSDFDGTEFANSPTVTGSSDVNSGAYNSGAVGYIGSGTFEIDATGTQTGDTSAIGGAAFSGTPSTAFGDVTVTYNYTAIPEPSAALLGGLGALLLLRRRR